MKCSKDPKAFIEYSINVDDIYETIDKYNQIKEHMILTVFDDMIADIICNKNFSPIVTKLFIRNRKLSISVVFIKQSYFAVPKNIRLNYIHCVIIKIPNKRELQQIVINDSLDIDFKTL